jgi:hypothetical protein
LGRGGGADSGRRPAPPVRPPPPPLPPPPPPGGWLRRTVESGPECGAAAARRRSGQVSASSGLPRAARGLGEPVVQPPPVLPGHLLSGRRQGPAAGSEPGPRWAGVRAGFGCRGPAGWRARSASALTALLGPGCALADSLVGACRVPGWWQVQGASPRARPLCPPPGRRPRVGPGPLWRAGRRALRAAGSRSHFLPPLPLLRCLGEGCVVYMFLAPSPRCPPGCPETSPGSSPFTAQ